MPLQQRIASLVTGIRRATTAGAVLVFLGNSLVLCRAENGPVNLETGTCISWRQEGTALVSAEWKGPVLAGKADGTGTLTVVVRYRNGQQCTGRGEVQMKDGALEGTGTLTWSDGQSYTGSWKAGLREGTGRGRSPEGIVYEGQWQNDAPSGTGTMTWPDGVVYTGAFRAGLRHGVGKLQLPDGRTYEGRWVDGEPADRAAYNAAIWPPDALFHISYDSGVPATVRQKITQVVEIIAGLFARYGIIPTRPIAVRVTADTQGYIRAINAVQPVPRSEIALSWGVSLVEKNTIVLRGNEMQGRGLIPVCAAFPHEAFHEAARQFSQVPPVCWWIEEGSAEYFRLMAMEEAQTGTLTALAGAAREKIRRARSIPDTRRLVNYAEANKLGMDGSKPIYEMALLMVGNLTGGDFHRVVSFYRLLHDGIPEGHAFQQAFDVSLSTFMDRMNRFFAELRKNP